MKIKMFIILASLIYGASLTPGIKDNEKTITTEEVKKQKYEKISTSSDLLKKESSNSNLLKRESSDNEVTQENISNKETVQIKSENSNEEIEQTKATISTQVSTSSKINYKDKIQIDGNVSEDLIELLNNELNKVPNSILNRYLNMGGKIILTSHDIATTYYNDYVIGSLMELYDNKQKILYVSARNKAIKRAAVHGMGHVFDSITGWKSYTTDEFKNIFNEEKNTIKIIDGRNYHKQSEKEYFAEAFYHFITDPSTTKSTAPKTVNFFENLISNI